MKNSENQNKILSFSLKLEDEKKLDNLTNLLNLKGRSETIRSALNLLDLESKSLENIKGNVNALLIITHLHSKNTLKISHEHQELIKTHIHTHIKDEKCTDLFVLEGKSNEINSLAKQFQKDKRTLISKLIIL